MGEPYDNDFYIRDFHDRYLDKSKSVLMDVSKQFRMTPEILTD
jgi:hypothetical protein